MIFPIRFLLFFGLLKCSHQDKHHFYYKFTAFSKANTLPVFRAAGICDDRQIKHYSSEQTAWIQNQDEFNMTPDPPDPPDWFIHQIKTMANCTESQCSEPRVLQRIVGCELEKLPNGSVKSLTASDEYGFDGEDFMAFNSNTMQWIEKNPKAKESKKKWDLQTKRNDDIKWFLETCTDWISTFNNTKKSKPIVFFNERRGPDDQHKLLTCVATGFYPRHIQMIIRSDQIKLENQTSTGVRPNADGSFQMTVSVKTARNHEGIEDCLVTHSSLTEPLSAAKKYVDHENMMLLVAVTVAVVAVVAAAAAAAALRFFLHKERSEGQKVMNKECSSLVVNTATQV